jgi:hypothetical protein
LANVATTVDTSAAISAARLATASLILKFLGTSKALSLLPMIARVAWLPTLRVSAYYQDRRHLAEPAWCVGRQNTETPEEQLTRLTEEASLASLNPYAFEPTPNFRAG